MEEEQKIPPVNSETSAPAEAIDESALNAIAEQRSKQVKIVVIVVILLALIAGGVVFFMMNKKPEPTQTPTTTEQHETKTEKKPELLFKKLDEFIINLNAASKTSRLMKLVVTFELNSQEDLAAVEKMMPRIKNVFQMYLHELNPEDMKGSVGLYRLREELLMRVNKILYPATVNDILFDEVLIQ